MKIDQLLTSSYLKQSDVDGETPVTIKDIKKQNVARKDEEAEYKYVLFFEEYEKGLVLNATNIKRLGKACGDDTQDWLGKVVTLYVDDTVEYGGNAVGGLRIKAIPRKGTVARHTSDDEVNAKLRAAEPDESVPF